MKRFLLISLQLFILAATVSHSTRAAIESPLEVIRSSNAGIISIYRGARVIDEQTQQRVFSVMEEVTDFSTIGERTTDGFCTVSDQKLCADLQATFIRLLKINATRKLGRYRADRFEYHSEKINGNSAIISTTAHYQNDAVQMDYFLEKHKDGWMIVNYLVDGIDTIGNYRRQFSRILQNKSVEHLVNRLQRKIEQLQNNP